MQSPQPSIPVSVYKRGRDGRIIKGNLKHKTTGTWFYDFTIRGVRYKSAIPEARNQSQAERAEIAAKEDVYNDRYGLRKSPLFAEFAEATYLVWARDNKRSYRLADAVYIKPLVAFFGKHKLAEISPLLIERYKKQRKDTRTIRGQERKPASVNREIETLCRIFSLAIENGLLSANPCRSVKKLRQDNQRDRYLTRDEEARLMDALDDAPDYLRVLVVLAIQTGMRKGELIGLRWEDIDLARSLIYVRSTKSGKPREIPLSREAWTMLNTWPVEGEKVFKVADVKKSFGRALRRAGIANFRFHDFRHTAATRWADAGADAFTIASLLGHSTIQMSARYTHAIDANRRRAVEQAKAPGASIHDIGEKKEVKSG